MAERITLNGEIYVPLAELEAVVDDRNRWRRTLALAHSYLHFDAADVALALIERDTGDTRESAIAVRSVVRWAKSVQRDPADQEARSSGATKAPTPQPQIRS